MSSSFNLFMWQTGPFSLLILGHFCVLKRNSIWWSNVLLALICCYFSQDFHFDLYMWIHPLWVAYFILHTCLLRSMSFEFDIWHTVCIIYVLGPNNFCGFRPRFMLKTFFEIIFFEKYFIYIFIHFKDHIFIECLNLIP